MDEKYFPKKVEAKWQKRWAETKAFAAADGDNRQKFYQLEMLPYPSGNLHIGHVRNYSVGDAVAWYKRLKGYNVLHPIGWDSFGQPAEDAAIKRGVNPREWTEENIKVMRGQLERLGLSYDWSRQMAAHRPDYYKFDQWFFLKMFEMGLAYKKMTQVNWCENDRATLSNEQASGGLCWRCGNPVTKKDLEQWFLRITAYADRLLDEIEQIEDGWPQNVIKRQRDWIGRSEGALVDFELESVKDTESDHIKIRVFTTRIDTIFGATALVLAPRHPVIDSFRSSFSESVNQKIDEIISEMARPRERDEELEKDGVDTGLFAINPFSKQRIPVWVGNYVMIEYGTGAVMSVPAHDERDFEFARKFGLPIRQVVSEPHLVHEHHTEHALALEQPFTDYGILVHSGIWNGKPSEEAIREMAEYAAKNGFGKAAVTYKLRDWGISRQRFWGAPIPIVYCDDCGTVPVPLDQLPVELPAEAPITGTGESPLAKVPEFVNASCPKCGRPGRRETDTMDTFVDSSWYFYRYTNPTNRDLPFDPAIAAYWTPVDQYIGGDDHAVMHLIYARFWTKVLQDLGLVGFSEPFRRLLTQGMVVGETFYDDSTGKRIYHPPDSVRVERDAKGRILSAFSAEGKPLKFSIERMSKSKGNGVDPDEMVEAYGADATRLFILFAAPVENELVWHESGIEGAVRFLQRVWRLVYKWHIVLQSFTFNAAGNVGGDANFSEQARKLRQKTHATIGRVTENLESLQFNTPVAALMELCNAIYDSGIDTDSSPDEIFAMFEAIAALVLMLAPFSPHIAEEMYAAITGNDAGMLVSGASFPEYDPELAKADSIEIAIQINGKLRSRILARPDANNEEIERLALSDAKIAEYTAGKQIVKTIVVPGRLINIVVR